MALISFNSLPQYRGGGRVLTLFLLFALALYSFVTAGFSAFAAVCMIPVVVVAVVFGFRQKMALFWLLFVLNYFIHFFGRYRYLPQGIPMSLYNESFLLLLIMMAIVDSSNNPKFHRCMNLMMLSVLLWCGFGILEIFNNTCGLGYNVGAWFAGYRLLCFQLIYIVVVFSIYIDTPEKLSKYLKVWALLSLFSAFWTFKQKVFGFTQIENTWLMTAGRTHVIYGGTLYRYFSTFSDAANYGCNAAAAAVTFLVVGITSRINKDRLFFILTGLTVIWGMFQSGTRTAIFCLIIGFLVFLVLSKSVKIIVPSAIIGGIMLFLLIFTTIGNGNQQIRRMRSAFNKEDASSNVRSVNQEAMSKYLRDAPWGIGIGTGMDNVPSNNKFRKLSELPPDSEYVFIWIRTGIIGITVFLTSIVIMFLGACQTVFFRIKSRSLMGIGAGICGSFAAIQLGGYGNQVLYQYPNGLIFFGALAVVYILPSLEPAWIEYEKKQIKLFEEKKRLKQQRKLLSRV